MTRYTLRDGEPSIDEYEELVETLEGELTAYGFNVRTDTREESEALKTRYLANEFTGRLAYESDADAVVATFSALEEYKSGVEDALASACNDCLNM